ncbi:MAG: cupredoxin domain-containing protein, partial [Thermomicrobiales bacterium]|nr:cupredoxin domain-containing protein [Thermomicrobiales bacterium]
CTGEIRGLQRDEAGVWQFQNLLDTALQITGSGQDANGDLYVTAVTSRRDRGPEGAGNGSIWKLVAADKVPEGAITVPLGSPTRGDVAVDENGVPLEAGEAPRGEESPAAAEAATPGAEPAQTAEATPETAAAGGMPEVVIEMYDIYFSPTKVKIPADTDVKLIFRNEGEALHNFQLKFKNSDIDVDVEPGATGEAVVNLPKGSYKFLCNVPGHKQAGMTGVLVAGG